MTHFIPILVETSALVVNEEIMLQVKTQLVDLRTDKESLEQQLEVKGFFYKAAIMNSFYTSTENY